jgi:hypothetical protein
MAAVVRFRSFEPLERFAAAHISQQFREAGALLADQTLKGGAVIPAAGTARLMLGASSFSTIKLR